MYYIRFNYIEDVEDKDVIKTVLQLKKEIISNYKDIIKDNLLRRPSFQFDLEDSYASFQDYLRDTLAKNLDKEWLRNLFEIKTVYYPKYKILAFMSNDKTLDKKYPYVEFQNSSDQNYKREDYHGFKFAHQIFDETYNLDDQTLLELYLKNDNVLDDSNEFKRNLINNRDYRVKDLIYKIIEKKLDVYEFLYARDTFDNEDHYFLTFRFINNFENIYAQCRRYFMSLVKIEIEKNIEKIPLNIHIENNEKVGECPCCHKIVQAKSNKNWCGNCMQILKWDDQ